MWIICHVSGMEISLAVQGKWMRKWIHLWTIVLTQTVLRSYISSFVEPFHLDPRWSENQLSLSIFFRIMTPCCSLIPSNLVFRVRFVATEAVFGGSRWINDRGNSTTTGDCWNPSTTHNSILRWIIELLLKKRVFLGKLNFLSEFGWD